MSSDSKRIIWFCVLFLSTVFGIALLAREPQLNDVELSLTPARETDAFKLERVVRHNDYSCFDKVLPTEGGYLVAGSPLSDGVTDGVMLAKYNDRVEPQWTAKTSLVGSEYVMDLIEVRDGYVVVGYTLDYTEDEFATSFIFKVDKEGQALWTKTITKSDMSTLIIGAAQLDDGFVLSGYLEGPSHLTHDYTFLAGYDLDGNELWCNSEPGYLEGINNTDSALTTMGEIKNNAGRFIYSAFTLDYDGNITSRTPIDLSRASSGGYTYVASFGNEFYFLYGSDTTEGRYSWGDTLAMADKRGDRLWDLAIGDDELDVSISAVKEINGELVFVGKADNDEWPQYKGLIGKVGMDGQGLEYTLIEDDNITGFYDVLAYKGGVMAIGIALNRDNTSLYGVIATFNTGDNDYTPNPVPQQDWDVVGKMLR